MLMVAAEEAMMMVAAVSSSREVARVVGRKEGNENGQLVWWRDDGKAKTFFSSA